MRRNKKIPPSNQSTLTSHTYPQRLLTLPPAEGREIANMPDLAPNRVICDLVRGATQMRRAQFLDAASSIFRQRAASCLGKRDAAWELRLTAIYLKTPDEAFS